MASSMTHTERKNDVLDEYPLAPLGVCCPALLMSFECLEPRGQHLILHGQKSITKPISLYTCIKPTGEEKLFSNCFSLAAELTWL